VGGPRQVLAGQAVSCLQLVEPRGEALLFCFIISVLTIVDHDTRCIHMYMSIFLEKTAAAAQEWAEANAVAFDAQKTEAILLSRGKKRKTAASRDIQVEGRTVNFNKQASRWGGSESGMIQI